MTNLLKLGLLALCLIASATHAQAGQLDQNAFFDDIDITNATISPNGQWIATISRQEEKSIITLKSFSKNTSKIIFDSSSYTSKVSAISSVIWIDNNHLALQFTELKDGIKDLLNTQIDRRLLFIDINNLEAEPKSVRTHGWLAHPLPSEPNVFLYARSKFYSKVYRINVLQLSADSKILGRLDKIDGGQFTKSNEVKSIKGYVTRWFFSNEGTVTAALLFNEDRNLQITEYLDDEQGKTIHEWKDKKEDKKNKKADDGNKQEAPFFMPLLAAPGNANYFCIDINEEKERKIYKVNFEANTHELVYETNAYKIVDILLNDDGQLTGAKVLKDGAIDYEYISDIHTQSTTQNKPEVESAFDSSLDKKHLLIYQEAHNRPGQFYYLNATTNNKQLLGKHYKALPLKLNTQLTTGSVNVEGLAIPYLLTTPINANKPLPLLVMPHGGPVGVFDDQYYDPFVQYFATQGYAVLRVNFRGSSGHSTELEEAGKGEWGNLMLKDIHEATKHVAALEQIDQSRICSVGFSYGGYASTMLTIKHPTTYKCAVNIAGLSDLNLFVRSAWKRQAQKEWLESQILPIVNKSKHQAAEQAAILQAQSPAFLAQHLQTPLFIGHGEDDSTVDIEHSYRLKLQLEKYNKTFTMKTYPDTGHNFSDKDTRLHMVNDITLFLSQSI